MFWTGDPVEITRPHHFSQRRLHATCVTADVHTQSRHGRHEPGGAIVQPEEPALPDRDNIIRDVTMGDAPVGDRDRGVGNRDDVALYPGRAFGKIIHRWQGCATMGLRNQSFAKLCAGPCKALIKFLQEFGPPSRPVSEGVNFHAFSRAQQRADDVVEIRLQ